MSKSEMVAWLIEHGQLDLPWAPLRKWSKLELKKEVEDRKKIEGIN